MLENEHMFSLCINIWHSNELDFFTRFVSHWFTYIKDGFMNFVVKIAMDQFHLLDGSFVLGKQQY